jgi:hypothetical protein
MGSARPGGAHLGRMPQQSRSREKVARILATTARLLEQRPYEEIGTKLIAADTEQTRRSSYVAVILADRMLDLAFRDNREGGQDILADTVRVLARYLDVPSRGGAGAGVAERPHEPGERRSPRS